jgi:hypothetical protein
MVDRVIILPPHSQIGPVSDEERAELIKKSPLNGKYEAYFDRKSAFEILLEQQKQQELQQQQQEQQKQQQRSSMPAPAKTKTQYKPAKTSARKKSSGTGAAVVKTVAKTLGSSQGQRLIRGLLGSLIR